MLPPLNGANVVASMPTRKRQFAKDFVLKWMFMMTCTLSLCLFEHVILCMDSAVVASYIKPVD